MAPTNKAAWLHKAGAPLEVGDAPMPTAGPNEIVVRNFAVAMNPLDTHMQGLGVFVQQFPAIIGCDVAGEVHEVGSGAENRFRVGDRVIGHCINLASGLPRDGAFALFTVVPADKAAILPPSIPFTRGVVLPFALEAAVCCLSGTKVTELGGPLPGVTTPALGLPYPTLDPVPARKTIIVYGGSSSVGATTTQLATAAGIKVIAITSARNASLSKSCGAAEVFDYKNPWIVDHVIAAAKASEGFFGIIDVISSPETYGHDLAILEALGGGHLACVHPPPQTAPDNVKAGMIFAVDDAATPVWRDYVTPALQAGKLQCLPEPLVVGKGLEAIQEALKTLEAGVSATKVVVEL